MKNITLLFLVFIGFGVSLLVMACANDAPMQDDTAVGTQAVATATDMRPMNVQKMETSVGVDDYFKFAGASYELKLIFGGSTRFDGTIVQTGNMDKIKLQQENTTMVYDGDKVHISTSGELNTKSARFSALTWPYFFSLPFKLRDPGTNLKSIGNQEVNGVNYSRAKLTFSAGTGDAPDDWYILYFDDEQHLAAAAYIVTFGGKSVAEALANAHAICYHKYEEVDGIQVARNWTFHDWSEEAGWTKQIGEASVTNVSMMKELPSDQFAIPAGAIAAGSPM